MNKSGSQKSRKKLIKSFLNVAKQFEKVLSEIKEREGKVFSALSTVAAASNLDPMSGSDLPSDHPLRKFTAEQFEAFGEQVGGWVKDVEGYERNTEFRSRHGDSLLLYVYGKVKAGKSSLGNYLAYGNHRPDLNHVKHAELRPQFFIENANGSDGETVKRDIEKEPWFLVNETEATKEIQGFCFPGLTWVDSPGVHSMTVENGELAKGYASSADLVVFAMNSSSPGQRSDLEEIRGLLKQRKPLVVLITGSDTVEEDEDADGNIISNLVMKSAKDRQDQVDYVQKELEGLDPELKAMLIDTKVLPVSVRYAESEPDSQGWLDSGFGAFADRLVEISLTHGFRLKREAPLNNLKAFCEGLRKSSGHQSEMLAEMRRKVKEERERTQRDADRAILNINFELGTKINRLADQYAMDNKGFSNACNKIIHAVIHRHTSKILKSLSDRLDEATSETLAKVPNLGDMPGFSKREKTIYVTSKKGEAVGGGIGSLLGGIVGWVISGGNPAGAVLGASIGGGLGRAAGSCADGEVAHIVDLGNNADEVSAESLKKLKEYAETVVKKLVNDLDSGCFGALEGWLENIEKAIENLVFCLEQQEIDIQEGYKNAAA